MNRPEFPQSAFPLIVNGADEDGEYTYQSLGMTLRDYFAAKAMAALIIAYDGNFTSTVSENAYKMADNMLAERENPTT